MTACVDNKQKKGRTAKAVSATLAGVLAVGMVPAAAFADPAAEAEAPQDDAALLAASDQEVLDGATLVSGTYADNQPVADTSNVEIEIGSKQASAPVVINEIKFAEENLSNLSASSTVQFQYVGWVADALNNQFQTYPGNESAYTTTGMPSTAGGYHAAYKIVGGDYSGSYFYLPFKMVNKSLANAFLYEGNDMSDRTFEFTNGKPDVKVGINDTALTEGPDYTISIAPAASNTNTGWFAGNYVAAITGEGDYDGSSVKLNFTIDPIDLSQVSVVMADNATYDNSTLPAFSNFVSDVYNGANKVTAPDQFLKLSLVKTPDGIDAFDGNGAYTFNITLKSQSEMAAAFPAYRSYDLYNALAASVKNAYPITINKVTNGMGWVDVTYDGDGFGTTKTSILTDYNEKTPDVFDANDVKVKVKAALDPATPELPYTFIVTDAYGNVQEDGTAALLRNGDWKVYVSVDAAGTEFAYGGMSAPITVKVKNASVANANVVFSYNGKNVATSASDTYNGTDMLSNLAVTVRDSNEKVLTEGTDYAIVVKDESGSIVDKIVNAGTYTIGITSSTYDVSKVSPITLTINPAQITSIKVTNTLKYGSKEFLDYTGSAITPEFSYTDQEGDTYALPDVYDMTIEYSKDGKVAYKDAESVTETGWYRLTLSADTDAEGYANFVFDTDTTKAGAQLPSCYVEVSDANIFADVDTTHWAADYVFQAAQNNYINGYAGTNIFRPDNAITRADAVIVLYNMAGGSVYETGMQDYVNDFQGYVANFNDVDSNAYYMAALSWAQKIGLVTGYQDGSGNFGPSDNVTREQFATMLYRYAEMTDHDMTIADQAGELAKYPDEAAVDGYAKAAVAWLSEQGIMTGDKGAAYNGYMLPDNDVTRAEVAKMAVELQPETIADSDIIA